MLNSDINNNFDATDFFVRLRNRKRVKDSQLERFHNLYGKDEKSFKEIFYKVQAKYDSYEYENKWRELHIEPPRLLEMFILDYIKNYGKTPTAKEEIKYFVNKDYATGFYKIYNLYITILEGQGTTVLKIIEGNSK